MSIKDMNAALIALNNGDTAGAKDILRRATRDKTPKYIRVEANVRYWEDGEVNGVEDTDGTLIPLREFDNWCPTIRLSDGKVMDWPEGTTAKVHYKVCDEGSYWLEDESRISVMRYLHYYVPDKFLAQDGSGHGDYIILEVGADGMVKGWREPAIEPNQWEPIE